MSADTTSFNHPSFGRMTPDRVIVFDTTLRDGEQSPGFSMNLAEKLRMAEALANLGVDVIEAGFPVASKGDFESVNEIAKNTKVPLSAHWRVAVASKILRLRVRHWPRRNANVSTTLFPPLRCT